jgi:hypothetical protein
MLENSSQQVSTNQNNISVLKSTDDDEDMSDMFTDNMDADD